MQTIVSKVLEVKKEPKKPEIDALDSSLLDKLTAPEETCKPS